MQAFPDDLPPTLTFQAIISKTENDPLSKDPFQLVNPLISSVNVGMQVAASLQETSFNNSDSEWFLAHITKIFPVPPGMKMDYFCELVDADTSIPAPLRPFYFVPSTLIIPTRQQAKRTNDPDTILSRLPPAPRQVKQSFIEKEDPVLAVFPDTTAFYPGRIKTIPDFADLQSEFGIQFEDDPGQPIRLIKATLIVPHPNPAALMKPIEKPQKSSPKKIKRVRRDDSDDSSGGNLYVSQGRPSSTQPQSRKSRQTLGIDMEQKGFIPDSDENEGIGQASSSSERKHSHLSDTAQTFSYHGRSYPTLPPQTRHSRRGDFTGLFESIDIASLPKEAQFLLASSNGINQHLPKAEQKVPTEPVPKRSHKAKPKLQLPNEPPASTDEPEDVHVPTVKSPLVSESKRREQRLALRDVTRSRLFAQRDQPGNLKKAKFRVKTDGRPAKETHRDRRNRLRREQRALQRLEREQRKASENNPEKESVDEAGEENVKEPEMNTEAVPTLDNSLTLEEIRRAHEQAVMTGDTSIPMTKREIELAERRIRDREKRRRDREGHSPRRTPSAPRQPPPKPPAAKPAPVVEAAPTARKTPSPPPLPIIPPKRPRGRPPSKGHARQLVATRQPETVESSSKSDTASHSALAPHSHQNSPSKKQTLTSSPSHSLSPNANRTPVVKSRSHKKGGGKPDKSQTTILKYFSPKKTED
ncbi:hypothetical protein BLNAU_15798 [Blattamonas nauphoetae]|uniref:SGF29 C-terminal domain-containing protein n=1 Tax=Blattamonas nauphoetae TaxID=2049346 RepID=A0ABQ9XGC0_9EUKA|nr:hypothetical protein BLNAU_15798 [Blattamonas nauphoetae]